MALGEALRADAYAREDEAKGDGIFEQARIGAAAGGEGRCVVAGDFKVGALGSLDERAVFVDVDRAGGGKPARGKGYTAYLRRWISP